MWETIQSGGPLMVPLIGCAVLALAFIIERLWVFSRLPTRDQAQEELDRLESTLINRGEEAVVEECNQGTGVLNFVFASLLRRYDTLMLEQREFKDTNEEIIRLSEESGGGQMGRFMVMQQELSDLKEELVIETEEASRGYLGKHLPVLYTIGNISPLLGLLGTIIGMILAFESIATVGTGDPKVVADGISQALVTTASGLIVAIPAIVAYRYLSRKAEVSLEQMELFGHAFSNALIMAGQRRQKG
jgi:biopolymer transport protein ExbB